MSNLHQEGDSIDKLYRPGQAPVYQSWYIQSIPLRTGRGMSVKTCALDDIVLPDDISSVPKTQFILSSIFRIMNASQDLYNDLFLKDIWTLTVLFRWLPFIYSLDYLDWIFSGYAIITHWCVFPGTISVAVNSSLCKYCLHCILVQLGCLPALSVVYGQLLPWLIDYTPIQINV